jgi:antitoxin VapB
MPLNIRDPEVQRLAQILAQRRGTTMTAAIRDALKKEFRIPRDEMALEQTKALQDKIRLSAKPGGRIVTKDELDDLWGHE